MRFAYIDSQGNEVEIPSEDALRLRIELGAIVADTSLYDGSADRWGAAGDHDLFRRLKRDVGDGVRPAPPSVGHLRPDPPVASVDRSPASPPNASPPKASPPKASPAAAETNGSAGAPAPGPAGSPSDVVLGSAAGEPAAREGAPLRESPEAPATDGPVVVETEADDDESFDFGDFGALDLEAAGPVHARSTAPTPENPTPAFAREPAPYDAPPADPWTVPGREPWPPEPDAGTPAPRSGLDAAGFGDEPAPPLDPASTSEPHPFEADEEMPDWLRNDPEFGENAPAEAPSFPTRDQVRERYEADQSAGGARSGRSSGKGPARPLRRTTRARWPRMVVGLVAVGLVGGGAAWFLIGGDRDAAASEILVEIPSIAPSLEPVFRSASATATTVLVDSLAVLPSREGLPESPDDAWLGGRYMANASRFPDVRLYWESVGRYAQIMQAREEEIFSRALGAALDTIPLPPDDRAAVEARAVAGFAAAAPDRAAVYGQLRSVVDAALTLHVFLEQNEADIDYDPADAGLSRDPVLEAVPVTESLGKEMWNRVAEITSALDNLGFLDKVTTERMLEVFHTKLAQVPVR